MADLIPLYPEDEEFEIPLDDDEVLGMLGSMLMDELYGSEIWQPMPSKPKRKFKPRRKSGERYVPNYAYKPKGKNPWKYYKDKVEEVGKWLVCEAKDVNYALRVYEGWEAQAEKLIAKEEWYHAVLILDVLLWEVSRFHAVHGKDYPKHQSRMRKLEKSISESYVKTMRYSKEKNLNWVEEDLKDLYRLLEREPFCKGEGGFDMQAFINEFLALLPEEKAEEFRKAHPSKEDLLKQEIKVELPKPIPFPKGIEEHEKGMYLYDVVDTLPMNEYVSMVESLYQLFLGAEKQFKAYKIFDIAKYKELTTDYQAFRLFANTLAKVKGDAHRPSTVNLCYMASVVKTPSYIEKDDTDKRQAFMENIRTKLHSIIWRDWNSSAFKREISEKQVAISKRVAFQQQVEREQHELQDKLEGLAEDEKFELLQQASSLLSKKSNLLCDKYKITYSFLLGSLTSYLEAKAMAEAAGLSNFIQEYTAKTQHEFMSVYEDLCKVALEDEAKDVGRKKYAKKVIGEVKQIFFQ